MINERIHLTLQFTFVEIFNLFLDKVLKSPTSNLPFGLDLHIVKATIHTWIQSSA